MAREKKEEVGLLVGNLIDVGNVLDGTLSYCP